MMTSERDSLIQETGNWLESPEGQTVLAGIARAVLYEARSKNLSPEYLKLTGLGDAGDEEILDEIRQELALFVLEKRSLQKIITAKEKKFSTYLKTSFIYHWIEKTRGSGLDPWRSLYKHAANVLNQAKEFHSISRERRGTAFSMTSESAPIPPLSSEDLSEIVFPDQVIEARELEQINKKDIITALATHFWEEVSGLFGNQPVLIDLRDFINWIGLHVPLLPVKTAGEQSGGVVTGDQAPSVHSHPDKDYFNPEMVKQWAGNFANRLTDREKHIACLAYRDGLGLKEIAQKMGYKGASGPKYQLDQLQSKWKFFLRDLPWLSPDDLNEEAFSLFLDTLLFILKKSLPTP